MPVSFGSNRRRWLFAIVASTALVAAACGGGDDDDTAVASAPPPATEQAPDATDAAPAPDAPDEAADGDAADGAAAVAATASGSAFAGEGLISGAGNFDWQVTRVDQGTKPDIAIDVDGSPLIAYTLERRGDAGWVRVASGSGGAFVVTTLQTGYLYAPLDLEISASGTAAVAYHNHDWEDAAIAIRDADGAWGISRVPDGGHDGWDNSLAFGADGSLHALGVDPSQFGASEGIEYATVVDGQWTVQSIGSGPQPYEWGTDIAIDAQGVIHVVYFDAAGQDLIYGRNDGGGWDLQTIYDSGDAGRFAVLAVDESGAPHVAFFQSDDVVNENGRAPGNIVYGSLDGTSWSFETIGAVDNQVLGFEGARRTLAIDLDGATPVVAYLDEATLTLATREGGAWTNETLFEADGDPFQVVGLALDADGAPHLTFSTISANGPLDGEVWYVAPVSKA